MLPNLRTGSVLGLNEHMPRKQVVTLERTEAPETVSLGEVTFCRPEAVGPADWAELVQGLRQTSELCRLARALAG